MTTLDVSPRVNQHLRRLAARPAAVPYTLQLTLDSAVSWTSEARAWWRTACARAGTPATPLAAPTTAGALDWRAVTVSPDVLHLLRPVDLDIVYQRLDLPPGEHFDLVVATNVLIYYDTFEQALATANIAAMLAPGGILVSNDWLGDEGTCRCEPTASARCGSPIGLETGSGCGCINR